MKAKYILFTIACAISVCASAVEYGQYQPLYQTSSALGGYGSNYNASGYGSYGTSYSGYRSTSAISAPGAMYAPSLSSPFSTGRLGNSVYRSADENLARALQPTPSSSQSSYKGIGRRRAPGVTGEEEPGDTQADEDGTWEWDGVTWVKIGDPAEGDTMIKDGEAWIYHDGEWVPMGDQDGPNTPVGSIPWLLMALLVGVYAYRHKKEVI